MRPTRSSLNRRQFFARSALAAAATSIGGGLFDALVARSAYAGEPQGRARGGYGPLRPAGDDLALPVGFHYRVISNEVDPMDDGFPTPKAMDGMAAFVGPNGNIVLVRNHECCVSPRGGVVFCEDATAAQHIRAVSRSGEVFDLARNLRNTMEFAGACFSPDDNTL